MADQGNRIFDYNLGAISISSEELDKIIQVRNISFNRNTERKFEDYIQKENAQYSESIRREMQDKYLSYLREDDRDYYLKNNQNWSVNEALSFWNDKREDIKTAMEDNNATAGNFYKTLDNWKISEETSAKREIIQDKIDSVHSEISSLEGQMKNLNVESDSYEYDKMNLQNQIDYQRQIEASYHSDYNKTYTKYAFEDKTQFNFFQSMLGDNDISYASTGNKVNGQYVVLVNEGFNTQIRKLSSEYEDMKLNTYREKYVADNYKTTDENGNVVYYYGKENKDIGADLMYSTFANPAFSNMGAGEISKTMSILSSSRNILQEKTSIFSPDSVLDRSYEQNFSVLENREKRMAFIESKYGISREDLYNGSIVGGMINSESDDSVDIDVLAKNKYEKFELQGLLNDRDSLLDLEKKYNVSFNIKGENSIEKMSEFSKQINNINAKLLDNLQNKLVYNGRSMIVNGRLDITMFRKSGLTAKDLGISENEFKILKDCAAHDGIGGLFIAGTSLMGKVISRADKYGDGQDFSWYAELESAIDRTKKVTEGVKNVRKFAKEMDLSDLKLSLRSKVNPKIEKKSKEKIKTSANTVKKTSAKVKSKSAGIEKARKKEERRLIAKQRFDKSLIGKTNAGVNSVKKAVVEKTFIGKVLSKAVVAIKAVIGAALKYVAIAGAIFAVIATFVFLIVVVIVSIPSFFDKPEIEDSVMYALYEYGMKCEDDWIESLKDTDSYWKHRDEIAYGMNWYYWTKGSDSTLDGKEVNQYVRYVNNKVDNARVSATASGGVGTTYINPFSFNPASSIADDVEHKVTEFDGGVSVELISNFNIDMDTSGDTIVLGADHWTYGGGHTCNVKDILCMLDVMMGFETSGDWSDTSLEDSVAQNLIKDSWANMKHGTKLLGYGIASTFDDEAYGKWAEEKAAGSGSVGYFQLQNYMNTLFSMSHQEQVQLEVVSFPIKKEIDSTAPVSMASDGKGLQMAYNDLITECPGGAFDLDDDGEGNEIHACCEYDDFKTFFYDTGVSSVPLQVKVGIEDEFGKMHQLDKTVYFPDSENCISNALLTLYDSNETSTWTTIWNKYSANDCWDYSNNGTSTNVSSKKWDELSDVERAEYNNHGENSWSYYKVLEKSVSGNNPNQRIKLEKTSYKWSSSSSYEKIGSHVETTIEYRDDNCSMKFDKTLMRYVKCCAGHEVKKTVDDYGWVTRYTKTSTTETLLWDMNETCEGHKGYYCGGHLMCHVTGIVYSFKENDIAFVNGDLEDDSYVLEPTVGSYTDKYGVPKGMNVDYSTFATAKATGLNLAENYDLLTPDLDAIWAYANVLPSDRMQLLNKARLWTDIFHVDQDILYGRGQFRHNNYKQYEGWTEDNMTFALMKYAQDWNEIYGFDIATEIGFGEISYADMEAIDKALSKKYGSDYNRVRKHVVNLALTAVGNGSYSSNEHHWHAYTATKHGSVTCTASDCSGFASYPIIQTERDLGISLNKPYESNGLAFSCSELAGFENGMTKTTTAHATSKYKDGTEVVNSDYSNCKPGDIISKVVGDEGQGLNHSVVFIGVLDEDLVLPSGRIIRAGKPMEVDCTTITEGGNMYFRSFGSTEDTLGYYPWNIMYNWDSEYASGNRSLWVRDITYGLNEEDLEEE